MKQTKLLHFESFMRSLPLAENARLFHFGDYEIKAMRRLKSRLQTDSLGLLGRIEDRATNVLKLLYHHFYFPVFQNSLKTVAEAIGFQWSEPGVNGLTSIIWRHDWEQHRDAATKQRLLRYNNDDCEGLRHVTDFLLESLDSVTQRREAKHSGINIESTESLRSQSGRSHLFGRFDSQIEDLNAINKCAYFDYQQERVFARSGKRQKRAQGTARRKRRQPKANKTLELRARRCPDCQSRKISKRNRVKRRLVDLRFGSSSVKKWVVDFQSFRYVCKRCDTVFLPSGLPDNKTKYGHGLASWCVYNHLVGGQNMLRIRQVLLDAFGLDVPHTAVWRFKRTIHDLLEPFRVDTWQELLNGSVLYIDETEVKLRGMKGYVWVFASPDRVRYEFRQSREATFLPDFLSGFQGVVVSDFFTGYDSLPVPQQKCLIHLIRDMNADLRTSPFDEELRQVVQAFATWLKDVTCTIDRCGLQSRRLRPHRESGSAMLESIAVRELSSDAAKKYQSRLAKYGNRLMTFTEYDGVSWNNNPAEHAIKAFARFRRFADGRFTETSVRELLGILSVIQTLQLQNRDVLSYLKELNPSAVETATVEWPDTGFGSRPEEQVIVKRIVEMRRRDREGNRMTYQQIADVLNEDGIPTRRGGAWWGTTVRNVLRRNRRRRK